MGLKQKGIFGIKRTITEKMGFTRNLRVGVVEAQLYAILCWA